MVATLSAKVAITRCGKIQRPGKSPPSLATAKLKKAPHVQSANSFKFQSRDHRGENICPALRYVALEVRHSRRVAQQLGKMVRIENREHRLLPPSIRLCPPLRAKLHRFVEQVAILHRSNRLTPRLFCHRFASDLRFKEFHAPGQLRQFVFHRL
jgi:hypothetical protein